MTYIPYLSTIITFAFVVAVYNRYRQRGGTYLLLWAIGLFFYGLGTLSIFMLLKRMYLPIQFNNERRLHAQKICDKSSDWRLPSELESVKLTIPKYSPQNFFCISRSFAQFPCMFGSMGQRM